MDKSVYDSVILFAILQMKGNIFLNKQKGVVMKYFSALSAVFVLGLCTHSLSYTVSGSVSDSLGNSVPLADVFLLKENKKTQTNEKGRFEIHEDEVAVDSNTTALRGGLISREAVSDIRYFDVMGNRVENGMPHAAGTYFARVAYGNSQKFVRFSVNARGESSFSSDALLGASSVNALTKTALQKAAVPGETLRVVAAGFDTLNVPISSLDTSLQLVLQKTPAKDTLPQEEQFDFGYALKNKARPSKGCGKPNSLNHIFKYTSAGIEHEVYLDVPKDYDNNKPYRLIFGMHCMGGSAKSTVEDEHYYRLIDIDTEHSSIFVAPHGYTDGSPWRVFDDKDHVFIDELMTYLEDNLCIDTTRVFSTGFSFGAMFTNSLAQDMQHRFRAMAVYATADINIYLPKNAGKPIAWMGTVGNNDGLCTPQLGRSARDRILRNNGIGGTDASGEKAEEFSGFGNHVCYDYKTVDPRFPVKWCTFNGGHEWEPKDGGEWQSWVPKTTWEFFNQF